jgi:hypothetical protein
MGESVTLIGYWIPYLSSTLVQGFPPPKNFIPGLQAAGLNVDFVNLYDVKQKYGGNEIKRGLAMAQSDKIILSYWDYIYNRDLDSIFSDPKKKFIFCINWNEEPRTFDQKMKILKNSNYVTLSQQYFRHQWIDELGEAGKPYHDRMVVWRFPCTTSNAQLDKKKCRELIGQKTDYSAMVWGYYGSGKGHLELLQWAIPLTGTTILFCGTPASPEAGQELRSYAFRTGIESRVLFSKPLITDEEADIWFSAADINVITYWKKIGESSLAFCLGHKKAVITSDLRCFPEYQKLGAIVMSDHDHFPETMVKYLIQPGERALQEQRATAYANQYNWLTTGLLFKKLVESM